MAAPTIGRRPRSRYRLQAVAVTLAAALAASLLVSVTTTLNPGTAAAGGTWMSGASGKQAANGTYGAWRGTALMIGGTWTDTVDAQLDQWMICEGPWAAWNKPLDLAIGAIFHERGETWAAAARGAYTARWTAILTRIRSCWGRRDPAKLYIRFAQEMNISSAHWAVRRGEEASFAAAMRLFSDLRYRILPKAQLVFCPNDGTDGSLGGLDVRKLWPGKDSRGRLVANVYAVDSYNWWPHVTTAAAFTQKINRQDANGAPHGIERHRQLAARLGVPFAISEWSNNGDASAAGGGESTLYVRQFNAWARQHAGPLEHPRAGQLIYEIHFNQWTEFAFWPRTMQPKTAAAYRALRWGR